MTSSNIKDSNLLLIYWQIFPGFPFALLVFMIFFKCTEVFHFYAVETISLLLYVFWLWLYRFRKAFSKSHRLLSKNHNHDLPCDSFFIVGQGINSNWRLGPALMLTSPLNVLYLVDHNPFIKNMFLIEHLLHSRIIKYRWDRHWTQLLLHEFHQHTLHN